MAVVSYVCSASSLICIIISSLLQEALRKEPAGLKVAGWLSQPADREAFACIPLGKFPFHL